MALGDSWLAVKFAMMLQPFSELVGLESHKAIVCRNQYLETDKFQECMQI